MGDDGRATHAVERRALWPPLLSPPIRPGKGALIDAMAGPPGMTGSEADRGSADVTLMRRALDLARRGVGLASPNPMVGAVVARSAEVVGEGWHRGPGTPHAEILALRAAGDRARGATLYVTLEPCTHQGRTPPCAPVVLSSGIARVVAAMRDPNPAVDGSGFELLRRSGVEVDEGILGEEAATLIAGFAKHVRTGLPLVTLKMAASLDGKVAASDGSSRWVTGPAARRDAHLLRAASDAVVVGAGTVVSDDPALTVRLEGYGGRQPLRVVVDAAGRSGPERKVFDGSASTLVATTAAAPQGSVTAWTAAGAEVVPFDAGDGEGVPVDSLIEHLGKRDVLNVLVEGGPTLAWSAIRSGVVDRLVIYFAPKLIGGERAPGVLGGDGVATIAEALPLRIREVTRVGQDLKVVADVHRDR